MIDTTVTTPPDHSADHLTASALRPITGNANLVDSADTIAPPGPPFTYLGVGTSLIAGGKTLAAGPIDCSKALALVCAHALECLLKASLTRHQRDVTQQQAAEKEVRSAEHGHNITWLWTTAVDRGLPINPRMPLWAERLAQLHVRPYHLRYSTGVHGVVLPGAHPMVDELGTLALTVRRQVMEAFHMALSSAAEMGGSSTPPEKVPPEKV